MSNSYCEIIYSEDFFKVVRKDNAVIVDIENESNLLSSSWLNGGFQENIKYVVNQSLTDDDYFEMTESNFASFQKKCMNNLGLNANKSTGLITSACMDNVAISSLQYKDLKVTSIVTAGADKNGIKAGDPASFYESNQDYKILTPGTINIITLIDANLEAGSLVTATITATEAKTSVLEDLKLESQYSCNIATGTGTDGICIISNKKSENHLENTNKHSKLGELIAKTIQIATYKALNLQTFMNPEFQKDVLSRLERFHITYDTLYNKVQKDFSNEEFGLLLYPFISASINVAWISCILNLVDEVNTKLLKIEEIEKPIIKIINYFTGYRTENIQLDSIDSILDYLINSILYKIKR